MKLIVDDDKLVIQGERPEDDYDLQVLVEQLDAANVPSYVTVYPGQCSVRVHLRRATTEPHEAVEVYDGMH